MGNKTEVSKTTHKKTFKNSFDVRTSLRLPIENTRSSCLNLIIAKLSLFDLTLVYSTFGLADQDVKWAICPRYPSTFSTNEQKRWGKIKNLYLKWPQLIGILLWLKSNCSVDFPIQIHWFPKVGVVLSGLGMLQFFLCHKIIALPIHPMKLNIVGWKNWHRHICCMPTWCAKYRWGQLVNYAWESLIIFCKVITVSISMRILVSVNFVCQVEKMDTYI